MQKPGLEIDPSDREKIERSGINTDENNRSGSFMMTNSGVTHVSMRQEGVEMLSLQKAVEKYPWVKDKMWTLVSPEKDEYTKDAFKDTQSGYFIKVSKGVKAYMPFQACFFIKQDKFRQKVHNMIFLEEGSSLHIINGCASSSHLGEGSHVGVTEMFIDKGATLMYTMIHDWSKNMEVRPRSAVKVGENGAYISNYIALRETKITQMYPVADLDRGAVAKFNSLVLAPEGSVYDLGARVRLNGEGSRAEIISRTVSNGGDVIARGKLEGNASGVYAHLECDGLMLKDRGLISAIPELETKFKDVNMSHEAAIGKLDEDQILYLMARGLTKSEAISSIVSGFMDVKLFGLPPALEEEIKKNLKALESGGL